MSCGSATSPEATCKAVEADCSRAARRTPVTSSSASATAQAIATVIGNHCTRWVRDRRAIRYSTAKIRTLGLEADAHAAAPGRLAAERAGVVTAAGHGRDGGGIENARRTPFDHLRFARAAPAVEHELDDDVAGFPGLQGLRRGRGAAGVLGGCRHGIPPRPPGPGRPPPPPRRRPR